MNGTKAFYIVEDMIADHENFTEEARLFVTNNKGNSKMQDEVRQMKSKIQEADSKLKPLYRIRNAFYGV